MSVKPPCLEPECECCFAWEWFTKELRFTTQSIINELRTALDRLEKETKENETHR